ncbi:PAS domain S-box protein [Capilliphycus salinus ALCB114379]|uniref:PAS domain-containing sensor histidine kinase n=1 Tax=Capilliphycus salinus TaxID=2768948 RepID=UPI0039A740D0
MTPKKKAKPANPSPVRNPSIEPSPSQNSNYRKFIEYMPTAVAMLDRQMRYVVLSKQWQTDFAQEGINLIGCSHDEFFPNLPQIWHKNVQDSLAGTLEHWELECPIPLRDNSTRWVKFNVQSWLTDGGNIGGLIVQVEDISLQKQLEREKQQAQQTIHQAGDAIYCLTPEGQVCCANPATSGLLGYSEAELFQLKINDIAPDFSPVVWQEHYHQVQKKGHLSFQSCHQKKNGKILPVEVSASYLGGQSETENNNLQLLDLPLICWLVRDISNHQAAHSAITASRDQLEAVLNAVPGLVSWIGSDLRYLGVNKHLAQAYNVPAEEFVGREVGFLQTSPEFNQFVYQFFENQKWIDSQEITANVQSLPRTYLIVAQKYQRGKAAVFVGLDITQRQQMEAALRQSEEREARRRVELEEALAELQRTQAQLVQTEKMLSLSQLVAGVAHEVNNPVNFIFGNLSHAQNYLQEVMGLLELYQKHYPQPIPEIEAILEDMDLAFIKQDLPQLLESMKFGAERIRDVVRSLRLFTHVNEAQVKTVDLHEGLNSVLMILQNRLQAKGGRSSIELVKDYGDLPRIQCYASQLNQVFMNLITFGIERIEMALMQGKMRETPRLKVRTQWLEDEQISVSISDNSPGMSKDECQQVFQPLFKGKNHEETSMGLSIAYHLVVEQHRGQLECFSDLEHGTEFIVRIPSLLVQSD